VITADEGSARKQQDRVSCSAPASEPLPSVLSVLQGKKKLKSVLKKENPIQGWILPAAKGYSSQNYLLVSPYLQNSMYCLKLCQWDAVI